MKNNIINKLINKRNNKVKKVAVIISLIKTKNKVIYHNKLKMNNCNHDNKMLLLLKLWNLLNQIKNRSSKQSNNNLITNRLNKNNNYKMINYLFKN
jgi:hypothetical protein